MQSEKSLTLHLLNQSRRDAVELARRKHIIDRLGRRVARLKNRVEEVKEAWLQQHKNDVAGLKDEVLRRDEQIAALKDTIRALSGGKRPWYIDEKDWPMLKSLYQGKKPETPQDAISAPNPCAGEGSDPETQPRAANDLEMPF